MYFHLLSYTVELTRPFRAFQVLCRISWNQLVHLLLRLDLFVWFGVRFQIPDSPTVWTYTFDIDFFNSQSASPGILTDRPYVCPTAGSNSRWFLPNNSCEHCCMHSFMAVRWRCCKACVNQELQLPATKSLTPCWIPRFPGRKCLQRPIILKKSHTHTHLITCHHRSNAICYQLYVIIWVQRCSFVDGFFHV